MKMSGCQLRATTLSTLKRSWDPGLTLCASISLSALEGQDPAAKGKATWGIVLNILAVVICIALVILYALGVVTLSILQESSY